MIINNKIFQLVVAAGLALTIAAPSQAGVMQKFVDESWTQFQAPGSNGPEDGSIEPGAGGQAFDAEYLFYKWDGSVLNIALQTGFDVVDGHQLYSDGRHYYAGDLALSFDGDVTKGVGTTYEYGADFGLYTRSYATGHNNTYNPHDIDFSGGGGIDTAGLYKVSAWDNDVVGSYHASSPFAIDAIDAVATAADFDLGNLAFSTSAAYGVGSESISSYRIVSFDTAAFNIDIDTIGVHWTMSCGNDAIDGVITPVPEPTSIAVVLLGLIGLFGASIRAKRLQSA